MRKNIGVWIGNVAYSIAFGKETKRLQSPSDDFLREAGLLIVKYLGKNKKDSNES